MLSPFDVDCCCRDGPLQFMVLIDHTLGAVKRSKVSSVQESASRVAKSSSVGNDVASWLEEGDEEEKAQRMGNPETRQFRIDETRSMTAEEMEAEGGTPEDTEGSSDSESNTKSGVLGLFGGKSKPKKPKKEYGKLPPRASDKPVDSQSAANSAIKKLFERR
jgi:hypothetical protein